MSNQSGGSDNDITSTIVLPPESSSSHVSLSSKSGVGLFSIENLKKPDKVPVYSYSNNETKKNFNSISSSSSLDVSNLISNVGEPDKDIRNNANSKLDLNKVSSLEALRPSSSCFSANDGSLLTPSLFSKIPSSNPIARHSSESVEKSLPVYLSNVTSSSSNTSVNSVASSTFCTLTSKSSTSVNDLSVTGSFFPLNGISTNNLQAVTRVLSTPSTTSTSCVKNIISPVSEKIQIPISKTSSTTNSLPVASNISKPRPVGVSPKVNNRVVIPLSSILSDVFKDCDTSPKLTENESTTSNVCTTAVSTIITNSTAVISSVKVSESQHNHLDSIKQLNRESTLSCKISSQKPNTSLSAINFEHKLSNPTETNSLCNDFSSTEKSNSCLQSNQEINKNLNSLNQKLVEINKIEKIHHKKTNSSNFSVENLSKVDFSCKRKDDDKFDTFLDDKKSLFVENTCDSIKNNHSYESSAVCTSAEKISLNPNSSDICSISSEDINTKSESYKPVDTVKFPSSISEISTCPKSSVESLSISPSNSISEKVGFSISSPSKLENKNHMIDSFISAPFKKFSKPFIGSAIILDVSTSSTSSLTKNLFTPIPSSVCNGSLKFDSQKLVLDNKALSDASSEKIPFSFGSKHNNDIKLSSSNEKRKSVTTISISDVLSSKKCFKSDEQSSSDNNERKISNKHDVINLTTQTSSSINTLCDNQTSQSKNDDKNTPNCDKPLKSLPDNENENTDRTSFKNILDDKVLIPTSESLSKCEDKKSEQPNLYNVSNCLTTVESQANEPGILPEEANSIESEDSEAGDSCCSTDGVDKDQDVDENQLDLCEDYFVPSSPALDCDADNSTSSNLKRKSTEESVGKFLFRFYWDFRRFFLSILF